MPKGKKKKTKHPWFKKKGYLHFDYAQERKDAEIYVTNPANILRHRFSPLIHYTKISRKVQRDKEAEKAYKESGKVGNKPKLKVKTKPRNIFYSSHIDGYIYSYYAYILQNAYKRFLEKNLLKDNVIAYWSIEKSGIKYCNSYLANEAFEFVRSSQACNILCFDISKFFDKLSVDVLLRKWTQILEEERLSDHHYVVYRSLVNFRYIEEGHLIEHFKFKKSDSGLHPRFDKNPRQHGLSKETGGSSENRICNYKELRNLADNFKGKKRRLIKKKQFLEMTGIPQGTAISGLLSNIFMIDFDIVVKKYVEENGGCYRRYSDDIFIAIPQKISPSEVTSFIRESLEKHCGDSIKINEDKTEIKIYHSTPSGGVITSESGKASKVQYLGFHFDGQNVFIRNSSISKDRGKTVQLIRKHKKKGQKINTAEVYKQRSSRKITPYNRPNSKGFIHYADRAGKAHKTDKIASQVKKNDKFIKRAISKERTR